MFERLDRLPPDPILGLMAAFRADTDPHKVDLGVGVYRRPGRYAYSEGRPAGRAGCARAPDDQVLCRRRR